MGLNISLYSTNKENTHGGKSVEFDSFRYSGDREYAASGLTWEYLKCPNTYCCDFQYIRPKNFSEHRKWIVDNILEANQRRLLVVLDRMEKDDSLYFDFVY